MAPHVGKSAIRKRKTSVSETDAGSSETPEVQGPARKKGKGKSKAISESSSSIGAQWPDYFHDLFKVFKAVNTVLAFVSSRKQMATTFPAVRSSVEGLLKKHLELSQVAELKALLPDIITFAYIPRSKLQINDGHSGKDKAADVFMPIPAYNDDEHVLVLEMAEKSRGKKSQNPYAYTLPPAMSPAAVKKLVESRNTRFTEAVDELLLAVKPPDDPVELIQSAGRAHVPVLNSVPSFSRIAGIGGTDPLTVPDPQDRPSIASIIQDITQEPFYKDQIVDRRTVEGKQGISAELKHPLSHTIQHALITSRNISSLYTHQVAAITALAEGSHVIVSTPTASGKSVIYQVPVLNFLEQDHSATAIFVYPTKALAQDQKNALEQLLAACSGLEHVKVATYDGDTPQEQRPHIRETASVIFTNFDMIHAAILPHEDLWRRFLKNLKLLAVDELHYYSGVFGSHVAQVLRRFRRVCAAVGNRRSQFVSCSATIAEPGEHMKHLFGIKDVAEITEDGAPSGTKDYLIWDPPPTDPSAPELGRRSALVEATDLMRYLMKRGVRVILFCKVRKVCELAMKALRTDLSGEGRIDILDRVASYRGGYSEQDRRHIEHEAFSGKLLGIVATNALELGVDIGVLDAVIMLGFPTGIANFRQQSGRAGRRARDSLAVLVTDSLPIDQHYVNNPTDLYDQEPNELVLDLLSDFILEPHLQCAAHEMPLREEDEEYFGSQMQEICKASLRMDTEGWYHPHVKYLPFPAKHISLRGAEEEKYTAIDISRVNAGGDPFVVEEVEISRALFELYEGGVFLHQGSTYIVKEISHDTKIAKLIKADVNWITSPRDFTDVEPKQVWRIREIKDSSHRAFYGRVDIVTVVFGFFKIRHKVILDTVDVETPPWHRITTGCWIDVPKSVLDLMGRKGINAAAAIHSAQHAFLNQFPMGFELKTECKIAVKEYSVRDSQRKRPGRLTFYDPASKGSGMGAKAFDHVSSLLRKAHDVVKGCSCDDGCRECIHSVTCRGDNEVQSKLGALLILQALLDMKIDEDTVPQQSDGGLMTIVAAPHIHVIDQVEVEV